MSRIGTPLKVRQLQRTLYRKAKSEPEWRAWTLYGDLGREDVLREAMQRVKSNDGAAGIDGVTVDDMVGRADAFLEKADLQLNPRKTRRLNFREEGFDFLGFRFNWRQSSGQGSGRHYPHVEPSVRSCTRLRDKVRNELNHWTRWRSTPQAIGRVNRIAGGWANYFHHGNSTRVMGRMQRWLEARLRGWLRQKHRQRSKSRYVCYPQAELYSRYGLCRLPLHAAWNTGRTRQPSGERPPKAGCGRTARPV